MSPIRFSHGLYPGAVQVPSIGLWFVFMLLWCNLIPWTLAFSFRNSLSLSLPTSTSTSGYHAHFHSTPLVPTVGSRLGMKRRRKDRTLPFSLNMSPSNNDKSSDEGINPITKASWYAVEWFGNTFGPSRRMRQQQQQQQQTPNDTTTTTTTTPIPLVEYNTGLPPQSLEETLQRIQWDNDRSYFLSGQVDEAIYDPNCVFRDPFVSFVGRDRFVTNLANLGSFITKYSAKVLQYTQPNDTTIQTKIMVKLELNLPWKPILAWPWGVTYTIDPNTFCIIDHQESWDIEPWEGVQQIFRKPTLKL